MLRSKLRLRSFLACLAVVGLAACSSLPRSEGDIPDVSLAGLSFAEPGLFEQTLTIQLKLKNPNAFDIPLDGLNFALDVNNAPFIDGFTNQNVTLPSLGEIVVPVDITISTNALIERVVAVGTGQRLDYQLTGEADIGSWFAGPIPFRREGRLALPNLPGLTDDESSG